jgi:hypothetical protein
VALKVDDVAPSGYVVDRATVRQKKTGRPVKLELTETTGQAVHDYVRTANRKSGGLHTKVRCCVGFELRGDVLAPFVHGRDHASHVSYGRARVSRAGTRSSRWRTIASRAPS